MARVLMLSKALVVGIYQRKLEHIAQAGIELCAVVPPTWKDERGTTKLERAFTSGYRLEVLPLRFNGNFHLHFYAGLRRIIGNFQPDIVHIDEEPYNLAAWQAALHARRVGAKIVFFSWQNLKRDYPAPFSWGERWLLQAADYAIVGTDSAGDVWRAKGYAGPMRTIPQFGTDETFFAPDDEIHPRRDAFHIGYVGRLVAEKGIGVLLEALAGLDDRARLTILGSGPDEAALKARAASLGIAPRVTFLTPRPSTELPAIYRGFDALVLPSLTRANWKEQFGRVLVEAMACGVPVIGSDSGAIPGVIGDAGLITPEGDSAALRSALATLMDDFTLAAHLSMMGRERVLNHFTHQHIAAQTVDIYRQLLAERDA